MRKSMSMRAGFAFIAASLLTACSEPLRGDFETVASKAPPNGSEVGGGWIACDRGFVLRNRRCVPMAEAQRAVVVSETGFRAGESPQVVDEPDDVEKVKPIEDATKTDDAVVESIIGRPPRR